MSHDFRICEFCGCRTNAVMRACCAQGRVADLDAAMARSIAKFGDADQSDLDPLLVAAAQEMLDRREPPNGPVEPDPTARGKA